MGLDSGCNGDGLEERLRANTRLQNQTQHLLVEAEAVRSKLLETTVNSSAGSGSSTATNERALPSLRELVSSLPSSSMGQQQKPGSVLSAVSAKLTFNELAATADQQRALSAAALESLRSIEETVDIGLQRTASSPQTKGPVHPFFWDQRYRVSEDSTSGVVSGESLAGDGNCPSPQVTNRLLALVEALEGQGKLRGAGLSQGNIGGAVHSNYGEGQRLPFQEQSRAKSAHPSRKPTNVAGPSEAEFKILKARNKILETENTKLKYDLKEQGHSVTRLERQLKDAKEEKGKLESLRGNLETQLTKANGKAKELSSSLDAANRQNGYLQKDVDSLKLQQEYWESTRSSLEIRLNRALNEVAKLQKQCAEHDLQEKEQLSLGRTRSAALEDSVRKGDKRIRELETIVRKQKELIGVLQRQKNVLCADKVLSHQEAELLRASLRQENPSKKTDS